LALSGGFLLGGLLTWDISGILYGLGSLIGVIIQPDLDVDNGHIGDKYIRNNVGKWAEYLWDFLWLFYRRSFKHGGELSHFLIISTIIRVLYLYCFLIVVPHVIFYFVFQPEWNLWYVLDWYAARILENYKIILGLMGSDGIHFFLDVLTSEHKKKEKIQIKTGETVCQS
jgi:uncharacterized metal-binding protein